MAGNPIKVSVLALAVASLAAGPALAESAMQQLQGVQQQSDKAKRNPSLEGAKKQSGQGIDTKGSYAASVRADPQPKANPVGQKIYGPGGYKPAATTLRTNRAARAGHAAAGGSAAHHDADAAAGANNEHAAAHPAAAEHLHGAEFDLDLYGAELHLHLPACEHEHLELVEFQQPIFEQQFELLIKLVELQTLTTRLATLTAWR